MLWSPLRAIRGSARVPGDFPRRPKTDPQPGRGWLLRRSADIRYWVHGGDAGSQDIEVRLVASGVSVADDVETTLGASDGDIEQIGFSGCEQAPAGLVRIAAEDEDDDIGFLALHGVHGTDSLLPIPSAYLREDRLVQLHGLADEQADPADDPDLPASTPDPQLGEEGAQFVALGGNPVPVRAR
jgi:hypothetical protein